ncbi:CREC-EF hand family protein [Frigoriflavimonas asaccharolytica]|uniref:Ca2+-binding EF-hand superfamily protein n=1 Tax=Frigoriflavimonas asaccharolytica TaxID=2735899 RepID=A0A8J8K8M4_9FLAO|nr:EF-hand domain-containing protein [Frigoriflavimonas asaccharolytica]NRS92102.1 Ca2+-binding EF-hand superfamily protein [Frigoriflavimonas asaccharolytica]
MKNLTLTILFTVLLFSCNSQNSAENTGRISESTRRNGEPNPADILKQLDADGDSKISKDEAKGPLANDFAKIDSNEDGFITLAELEKMPKPSGRGPQNGGERGNAPRR